MSGTGKKTIVEFQDVVKTYGEGEALQYANNHVSFTIEEGEFVSSSVSPEPESQPY